MDGEARGSAKTGDHGTLSACLQVISTLEIPVLILDSRLRCLHANPSFQETFRLGESEYAGIPLAQIDNGLFDIDEMRLLLERLLAGAPAFGGVDFALDLSASGSRVFSVSGSRLEPDPLGKLVLLALRDVTEERSARKRQQDSEAKYRVIYESSRDGIMMLAPPNWRFTAGNPATLRMFRCSSEEEFVTLGPWDLSPPTQPDGQRSTVKAGLEILRAMENGSSFFEWTHRRLDGEDFQATVLLNRIQLEGSTMLQATVREIQSREGTELLRSLVENIPTVTYRCAADPEWTMQYISGEIERITGYPPSDYIGNASRSFSSVIHPDDRQFVADTVWKALGRQMPFTISYRMTHADGSIRWVFEKGQGIFGPDGALQYLDGIIFDNTDQKLKDQEHDRQRSHLEELVRSRTSELRESEEKYRSVVEQVNDGIFIQGDDAFLFVNTGMCTMTGYSKSDLYSMKLQHIVHPEDDAGIRQLGSPGPLDPEVPEILTVRLRARTGELLHCELAVRTITYRDRTALLGVCRDITGTRKQEDERHHLERLESLESLARSIAHDFNNFLTVILGNTSLALTLVETGSTLHGILSDSGMAASSASNLTQQLLAFSLGGMNAGLDPPPAGDLREALSAGLLDAGVSPELLLPDDLWSLRTDPSQIGRLVRSLAGGRPASAAGSVVAVRASNYLAGMDGSEPLKPGPFVRIEVVDSGPPIPEEELPALFDPFMTVRESASGLGFATAGSVVARNGGRIRAENLSGGGRRFTVFLPADRNGTATEGRGSLEAEAPGGRILVMDDKAMVRSTAALMLEHLGYRVESAGDGREAIRLYRRAMEDGRRFDAVILDLTVPGGMGGREALVELRHMDPAVRGVLSSGYSGDPVVVEHRQHGFHGVILKPYSLVKLSSIMREIMRD